MLKGIEILLARMDSNPEEFDIDGWLANWSRIYDRYSDCLSEKEREAIQTKRTEVLRDKFNAEVMSKLLGVQPIAMRKELTDADKELLKLCADPNTRPIFTIPELLNSNGGFADE